MAASDLEKKYSELLARVEKAENQKNRVEQLQKEVRALQKQAPVAVAAAPAKQQSVVKESVVVKVGLPEKERNYLISEVKNLKKGINEYKEKYDQLEKQQQGKKSGGGVSVQKFEAFRNETLERARKLQVAMKALQEQNNRLTYRKDHVLGSLAELEKKCNPPKPVAMSGSVRAVIYDCDGTLVNSEPFWRKAQVDVFATVGVNLTENDCAQTTGMSIKSIVELRFNQNPWDENKNSRYVVQKNIEKKVAEYIRKEGTLMPGVIESMNVFKPPAQYLRIDDIKERKHYQVTKSLERLRREWDAAEMGEISDEDLSIYLGMVVKAQEIDEDDETVKCALDNNCDEQWFPPSTLASISENDLQFAVCSSSCPLIINAALSLFSDELRRQFSVVVSAEGLPFSKPHPQVYMNTARKLKVNPGDCVAIEDSFPGVLSALSAGMKVLAVPEDKGDSRFQCAAMVLGSLEEMTDSTRAVLFGEESSI